MEIQAGDATGPYTLTTPWRLVERMQPHGSAELMLPPYPAHCSAPRLSARVRGRRAGFGVTHIEEMPEAEVEEKQLDDLLGDADR